jgi:hypothetical protein
MKCTISAIAFLALFALGSASSHPVADVIELLEKLMAQVNKDAQEEEYTYTKFTYWCKNSKETLTVAIAKEKETIDKLDDVIAAKKEEIDLLTEQIATFEEQLLELDKQDKKAKDLREKEEADYKFEEEQLKKTVEAMGDCITKLMDAKTKTSSLVQAKASVKAVMAMLEVHATAEQQQTLAAFVEQSPDDRVNDLEALGDKGQHVQKYKFKSDAVIELLKQLKEKFEADQLEVVKADTNSLNAFELAKAAREDERDAITKAKEAKDEELTEAKGQKKTAEAELTSTLDDLKADGELLDDTDKKCAAKASEWEERGKTRELELEAMKQAIKILSDVSGVRTEAPENPVPPPSPLEASFVQLSASSGKPDARTRAVQLLLSAAKDTKSKDLERFAQEMTARMSDGPFDEVNNMIEKMIFHLMAEQKDEDDHKAWCDLEVNKTDASISDKQDKIEELATKISEAKAYVQELSTEIQDATEMVAKLEIHMKESAEIRKAGKKENALAVKDAQDAQTAVANAIAVLETHYKETGEMKKEDWELMQTGHAAPVQLPDDPKLWDASYTGVTDPTEAGSGVVAVLKAMNADFAKMEGETKVQEERDQKLYEEEMKACEIEKATRLKEAEVKEDEKKRQVAKITTLSGQKKHTEDEEAATQQYKEDLQKACVKGTSTYEDRKAARAEEIDALHQAKDILKEAFKEKAPKSFLQRAPVQPHMRSSE